MITEGGSTPAPLLHRSVSQLGTFTRCGEAYRLEKIAQAPQTPAAWFAQGTAFHDAIERWEATGRIYGPDEIVKWYNEAWAREVAEMLERQPDVNRWETGGRTKPADDLERREARGRDQALAYREYALATADEWRIWEYLPGELAVEVPFEITLNGVTVIGKIDQIIEYPDGRIYPRDLKTGNRLPDNSFQLGVYAVAIWIMFGIKPGFGDYFMAKNNEPTKPKDLSIWTPELVGRMFYDMDRAATQGIFIPNQGEHCRMCGVRDFCTIDGRRAAEFAGITQRVKRDPDPPSNFQYA